MLLHVGIDTKTLQYPGEKATITSGSAAYITAVTESGEIISVRKDSALLSLLAENKKKIKGYKKDWNDAKDEKWSFIRQISHFWYDLGLSSGSTDKLNSEQFDQYTSLQDGKSNAIIAMHRASRGVHTTVLDSLMALS